jgi:hypothetical protein
MACPPGKILNPRTLRCIKTTGRRAHALAQQGDIPEYYVQAPPEVRRTAKKPRAPSLVAAEAPCPPDKERNPVTRRCIKRGGKTFRRLFQQQPAEIRRRTNSEGPIALPVGSAAIAPLADKSALLAWAGAQCKNDRDPLTNQPFASAEAAALQDLVRLHNRTCVMSGPLRDKVAVEHKAGSVATIPGDPSSHMTLDDFRALRDSRRRHDPGFKIPARVHQPPPPSWQLYVAPDNRSGTEYASVLIIDAAKAIQGRAGPEYPVDSVMIDMGFIPLTRMDSVCQPQMVTELLRRLAAANRLLTPVAGGWKPVAGFPFTKKYWQAADAKERFSKLCMALTKALTSPM